MKLHIGCGRKRLEGYINIDAQPHPGVDIVLSALDKLPYTKVKEIMAIHLFEHLWPDEAVTHLRHWHSILDDGGRLILEMPDIYKSAKNLIADIDAGRTPDTKMAMFPIYGDNPNKCIYDCHKTGWTFRTLAPLLKEVGFRKVTERPTEWHGQRQNRDFRIEAVK